MDRALSRALTQVAPGVWVATAGTWRTTTTLVVADDGACLLVDPALSPQELDALAEEIAARGWRVRAAVATHAHWDHVLWTPRFGDVPRWASGRTVERVGATHDALVAQAEAEHAGHGAAVTSGLRALPGDRVPWEGPAVLAAEHDAHAPGHLALVVPAAGVLLAGDMLSDTEVPLLDLDAADTVGAYRDGLATLARVRAENGVQVLVPGHGSVASGEAIDLRIATDRGYLDALASGAGRVPGGGPTDPRLTDPWLARQHAEQVAALRR
ncbi:MBL fold metallo-hydrolase [Cellulomonas soli]|uniref:MBL fold metallo-hydrolase n=1 Tax=Cellulomonas soli TaxID=931535 RepID=A0A512P9M5_9CELL|nr:MBL fold metallo-hydrolase [Cellulomonas soli]NYI60377.1 glyoxylase-like metal-dependent hydrolase (beta-lactamase superfamily II) [Cellulomonas soli]GEP67890.1 MBL fold metallo-hydrolase [Cellulomonas soli]